MAMAQRLVALGQPMWMCSTAAIPFSPANKNMRREKKTAELL